QMMRVGLCRPVHVKKTLRSQKLRMHIAELVNDVTTPCDPSARPQKPIDWIVPSGRVILRDFLYPSVPPGFHASPRSVGRLLGDHVDEPVKRGAQTLALKARERGDRALNYFVKVVED